MVDDGEADKHAQALRFLVALQAQQKPQDVEAQHAFLREKGLSDEQIERAYAEAKRPEGDATRHADGLVDTASHDETSTADAFDRATKQFDDPLHTDSEAWAGQMQQQQSQTPSLPPKTYPRSPLALYQQPQPMSASSIDNPLTRYHVLLRFFRSLCYFMVLGGGVTAVAVGLFRAYILPRLINTLDARSDLLIHHRQLFTALSSKVKSLRSNSLAPLSVQQQADKGAQTTRKGVLKKVQFADQVEQEQVAQQSPDEEDKKQAGDEKKATTAEDETQTAKGEKEPLLTKTEEDVEATGEAQALPPIDILEPLRVSLARLNQALKADLSAGAIGSPLSADVSQTPTSTAAAARATTVEEEEGGSGSESWESDEESEAESDELEFDPFAPPRTKAKSKTNVRPHKHVPKTSGSSVPPTSGLPLPERPTAMGTSTTALRSTLSGINAYINSQTYRASTNAFAAASGGRNYSAIGGAASSGGATDGGVPKTGEVGQVRAEIRSLKGLLLSRRNFPIYSRPVAAQQ